MMEESWSLSGISTGAGLQRRGSPAHPGLLGTLCFSRLMCLSVASAGQNTKCAAEITALEQKDSTRGSEMWELKVPP